MTPKICSFNILISQVSCGEEHTAFVSSSGHVYTMGNNGDGRLGLGDMELKESNVPCLVEGIADHFVTKVQCGLAHTIALTNNGEAWAWG